MPSRLKIGIAGAGAIARSHHLPGLREIDGVEVVGVANRNEESARAVARQFGVPRALGNWRELVADPEIDAIVVGTWPDMHTTIARAAIEAGKHVLVEGRLALDHPDALGLLTAARSNPGVTVMVVPAATTFWADRTVQRLLAEAAIGELRAVDIDWGGETTRTQHSAWRRDRSRSGNNVMEVGILVESVARWVGFPLAVQATEHIVETTAASAPIGFVASVPDLLGWQGELPGGAFVRSLISPLLPPSVLGRRIALTGTQASLVVDLRQRQILLTRNGEVSAERIEPTPQDVVEWRVEAEFVGAIRGEEEVRLNDLATAERYMAVTDAIRHAARDGVRRWVS